MSKEMWLEQLEVSDFDMPDIDFIDATYEGISDFLERQTDKTEEVILSSKPLRFNGLETRIDIEDSRIKGCGRLGYGGTLHVAFQLFEEDEENDDCEPCIAELEIYVSDCRVPRAVLCDEALDSERASAWAYLGMEYARQLVQYRAGATEAGTGAAQAYRSLLRASNDIKMLLQWQGEDVLAPAPAYLTHSWLPLVCDTNAEIIRLIEEEETTYLNHTERAAYNIWPPESYPVGILYDGHIGFHAKGEDEVQVKIKYESTASEDGKSMCINESAAIIWSGVRKVTKANRSASVEFHESLSMHNDTICYEGGHRPILTDVPAAQALQDAALELQESKPKPARVGDIKRFIGILSLDALENRD